MATPEIVLELKDVSKSFGPVEVLKNISFSLKRGTVLGLVGENGAGKSTMMNILGGVYIKTSGEFFIEGSPYEPKNPQDAIDAGIAFIHQELNLFTNMSVAENIFLDQKKKDSYGIVSMAKLNAAAKEILDSLKIEVNPKALVKDLPMGVRQMVEIAKAVAKNAKIIFFDEPTTSLSTNEKETLFSLIEDFKAKGVSVIYISHALEDVLNICDEVFILRDGRMIGDQKRVCVICKDEMITKMVGREMNQLYPYIEKNIGEEVFRVEKLSQGDKLKDISFNLRKGEIVGIFGLMGAGRSEMANAIYGVDSYDSGDIYFHNEHVKNMTPEKWISRGMAYITENRRDDGLLMPKSVKENLILVNLNNLKTSSGFLDQKKANTLCSKMHTELNIKTFDISKQNVGSLSGGNQQKVVIGKWLMTTPKVFILDEPTRGVDVGAKYEIYLQINKLVEDGSSILFISSEIEELMGVCDRVLIMHKGQIDGEMVRCDFAQEKFLHYAIGGSCNDYAN